MKIKDQLADLTKTFIFQDKTKVKHMRIPVG